LVPLFSAPPLWYMPVTKVCPPPHEKSVLAGSSRQNTAAVDSAVLEGISTVSRNGLVTSTVPTPLPPAGTVVLVQTHQWEASSVALVRSFQVYGTRPDAVTGPDTAVVAPWTLEAVTAHVITWPWSAD